MNITETFKCKVNELKALNFTADSNYFEIAKEIGCEFTQGYSSSHEVSKYIYGEIKSKLGGSDLDKKEFEGLRSQLLVEYFLDGSNDKYVRYIEIIRDATRELNSFIEIGNNWDDVLKLVAAHTCLRTYNPLSNVDSMYQKERAIAHSIKWLKSKGFNISLENGNVVISEKEHKRIGTAIDLRFKRLGLIGLNAIMGGLKPLFNASSNRYFFQRISSNPLAPWGYLFRLSLKHLQNTKRKVGQKKDLLDLLELAQNYSTVLNVQEYSQYDSMFQRPDTILEKIQTLVLGDQIYSIAQTDCTHIIDITRFIFSRIEVQGFSLPWEFDEYINVAETISSLRNNNSSIKFSSTDILYKLNNKVSLDVIEKILVDMSHNIGEINGGYLIPFDSSKCNQSFKPLVFLGNSTYLFLDSNFFSFGFYEIVSDEYRKVGVKDSVVGDLLEDFISNKFSLSGIPFLTGEKYKITKAQQKLFSTSRSMGECDFIVETDEVIIFIEVKKKILTRAAQSGNITNISTDLIKSFANAQIQANWHEIILRNEGVIKFNSGRTIELNGRDIEKISLSMFDYMALHDGVTIHQIMHNLVGRELISNVESDQLQLKSINKALSELNDQYKLPELKIYSESNNAFFNCRFFNLFHFIEILNNTHSKENFKDAIWANRHVSTGEKDWFKEMHYLKTLKKEAAKT